MRSKSSPASRWDQKAEAGRLNTQTLFESTDALVADVQSWVDDPESNFGWIIITDGTAKRFYSADGLPPAINRPTLAITYRTPAE